MSKKQKIHINDKGELENGMVRGLSNRHVQFIAIAGTIGVGLFKGAGSSISLTGPSIIFVYLLTGLFMYFMMRAMGEMLYQDPDQHTFINFISRYLGPSWGYFSGWSYWISLILLGMAEITAVGDYMHFWFPNLPSWIIQLVFLVGLTSINLIAVKVFGETEFWFAMIKIVAILALIATAIIMALTGFQTDFGKVQISNILQNFQVAPNGWMSFIASFQMVFFAYQAIEFVGITVSETANPRKVLPKAIREIPSRILIFYVGSLLAIMSIIPWNQLSTSGSVEDSPFVLVFQMAGFKWAAGLINFVILTSAASALNSTLYSTGRHLYQLSHEAPNKLMTKTKLQALSHTGVPSRAIIFSAIIIAGSALVGMIPGIQSAFQLITAASSGVYITIYLLTMWAHLRYRQSSDFMANGYLMPRYKLLNPLTMIFMLFVFGTLFLQVDTRYGVYGSIVWIICLGFVSYRRFRKQAKKDI
ncbi:amino acid permease [Streptococcus sp. DD13]|uniref:amino acid permease n=1 Tax=Streptococcus sp. DD13 TaxID=1777881 RepID=UPI0007924C15|nr:amino acid permease [Streptococcus sp. DD13]KXT79045.1 Histidine transport protein (permease) [Streptococcus sp. DD13]